MDWRHFPIQIDLRALVRFRGHLISEISNGRLASSTAKARMAAVISFFTAVGKQVTHILRAH